MAASNKRTKFKKEEALRFIIVGIGAFFISLSVYYIMYVFGADHNLSYISAYVLSTLFNFFGSTLFTFKSRLTIGRAISFALSHLFCLSIHVTVLNIIMAYLGLSEKVAPLIVMVLLLPLNFTMIRFALRYDFKRRYDNVKRHFRANRL